MSDGAVHSLFLEYSYNLHDPDFNESWMLLKPTFLRYSVTRRRFVAYYRATTADTAMHAVVLPILSRGEDIMF